MYTKSAGIAAAVALFATPAWAADGSAATPNSNAAANQQSATPGPHAGLPAKAKAYGRYCKTQSKKRADSAPGTTGTPFSQCVTAMAKLANGQTSSPREACKAL